MWGGNGFCGKSWVLLWWVLWLVVGVVVMDFFFFNDGDGGGWLWVAGCGLLFMVVAGEATVEAVEVAIAIGLDFVVVVCHYFNELSILF